MTTTAANHLLGLAARSVSIVDLDLSFKQRQEAHDWRSQIEEFRNEERSWRRTREKHRLEDLIYRKSLILQHDLAVQRREMDEKNEQLRNLSSVSAIIASFTVSTYGAMDTLTNNELTITLTAGACAVTVCLMTFTFLTCTLILVGTLKKFQVKSYDEILSVSHNIDINGKSKTQLLCSEEELKQLQEELHSRKTSFLLFWESTCEADWKRAYLAFTFGVFFFLSSMIMLVWYKFFPVTSPGIIVSVICGLGIIFLFWTSHMKWGSYLFQSKKVYVQSPRPRREGEVAAVLGRSRIKD